MDSAYIALIVIGVIIGLAIIGLLVYWSMKNARIEKDERKLRQQMMSASPFKLHGNSNAQFNHYRHGYTSSIFRSPT